MTEPNSRTVASKSSTIPTSQAAIGIVGASILSSMLTLLVLWIVSRKRDRPQGVLRDSGATLDFKLDLTSPTFRSREEKTTKDMGFALARDSLMPSRLSNEARTSTTESIPLGLDIDYPLQALPLPVTANEDSREQDTIRDANKLDSVKTGGTSPVGTAR